MSWVYFLFSFAKVSSYRTTLSLRSCVIYFSTDKGLSRASVRTESLRPELWSLLPGDLQQPPGHGPGQSALGALLETGWAWGTQRALPQPSCGPVVVCDLCTCTMTQAQARTNTKDAELPCKQQQANELYFFYPTSFLMVDLKHLLTSGTSQVLSWMAFPLYPSTGREQAPPLLLIQILPFRKFPRTLTVLVNRMCFCYNG